MGELIKPTFNPQEWGVFNVYYRGSGIIQDVKTNIKVDALYTGIKAFCYLVSRHSSSDDATGYEFGIVRLGYDGNHITKYIISQEQGTVGSTVNIDFTASEDGYVKIVSSSLIFTKILCWG